MFNIIRDSIFNPKGLIKQVNRSGWFIFLYIIILAIFMSLGSIMVYVRYENSNFTSESTGCSLVNYNLVCDGDNYDIDNIFDMYGMRVYFLNQDMSLNDISELSDVSIVVQGSSFSLYFDNALVSKETIFNSTFSSGNFDEGMGTLQTIFLIILILQSFVSNLILTILIILISTLMFLKYKQFIRYKKIFKLVSLAVTPVILLITIYNIIGIGAEFFFILGFVAYIPLFRLNKELYLQIATRNLQKKSEDDGTKSDPNVVENYTFDDIDAKDVDETEDDEKE